jgi:DtxR family transcriptional regulator, Mn-dependent transcriptional regulator
MELNERSEEILEMLWIKTVEEARSGVSQQEVESEIIQKPGNGVTGALCPCPEAGACCRFLEALESAQYVGLGPNGFHLTELGRPLAENVVRRHRLAERLFSDVLDAWNETNHEKACRFEHLLDHGLDDSICTLLGHPRVCPHGKPIPEGKCCREARVSPTRLISPLSQLSEGQKGKVAYIAARKRDQLQKLTAMGVLPGASLSALQTSPAFVFQAGQTQFAVDREIADAIYVRLSEAADIPAPQPARRRHGLRFGSH